jgi:hypothetical protein
MTFAQDDTDRESLWQGGFTLGKAYDPEHFRPNPAKIWNGRFNSPPADADKP